MNTNSVYTAALMEHNAHPDYKFDLEDYSHEQQGVNPSCGDEMLLKLRMSKQGDVIEEAAFTGHGCAVSQASADIMIDLITGKSIDEARQLIERFIRMIQGDELSEEEQESLDEAYELEGISRMPARVKCAELAWRTLDTLIAQEK